MNIKLCRLHILLLLALALTLLLATTRGMCQLEWRMHVQIEVLPDGSATWVVQQKTVLLTDEDEATFLQYLNITSMDQISNRVHSMIDQASLVTGRSMRVENLKVDANVSATGLIKDGIIQYQFDWIGFALRTGDDEIVIGDALTGEIDLSRNDELTIKCASEYALVSVYPAPDSTRESGRTLTWFGPRNFGAGEPRALLGKKNSSWTAALLNNVPLLAAIAAAISTGSIGYFLGLRRAQAKRFLKSSNGQEQVSASVLITEDDEHKVVRLLNEAGGRMYQSTIAEKCGFSKSKASELISVMEKKGVVSRKKIGKGKIVNLVERQETRKDD